MNRLRWPAVAWLIVGLLGCGELRPLSSSPSRVQTTYRESIQSIFASRCVRCHGPGKAEGGYDLSSYLGVMGFGSDETRNAIAGEEQSLLLTKLDPIKEAQHWSYLLPEEKDLKPGETAEQRRATDAQTLRRWVIQDRLAYFDVAVHPPGWLDPGDRQSKDFHGGWLRDRGWGLDACRSCHGQSLRGGTSKRSCETCHTAGVTACTVCHGSRDREGASAIAPPGDLSGSRSHTSRGVGAHQVHLADRTWWAKIDCQACHRVPSSVDSPGHLFDDETAKSSDHQAEIAFGAQASLHAVKPSYESKSGACSVYCHGAAFEPLGQGSKPVWTETGSTGCGSCHSIPARFGGPECTTCHPQSVKPCAPGKDAGCLPTSSKTGVAFLDPALHGDGRYPLGKAGAEGTCYGCHGNKESAGAPAPDLHGKSATSEITVGLHQAHLTDGTLSKAVPCESCHLVPKAVQDKGHFDDDLPAEVVWSPLAKGALRDPSLDLKPTWDRTTGSCSNVYCHTLDSAEVKEWKWTSPRSLSCDSCHGQPPTKTATGKAHASSTSCKSCHGSAYDAKGLLDPSKHINGRVDL